MCFQIRTLPLPLPLFTMRAISVLALLASLSFATASASLVARQAEPSPTGRGACIRQGDSWTCELGAVGAAATSVQLPVESTASATSTEPATAASVVADTAAAGPSPTGQGECTLHIDHWDCEGGSHEGHSHEGHSHEGHSHAGHSHGPSEEYGCGLAPLEVYNLGLHVAAIFILLVASIVGVTVPYIGRGLERVLGNEASSTLRSASSSVTFAMRHFGGGIILSTAFIHLLYHAFVYFSNECIGVLQYEAASPAIAMAAVYVVFLIDFLLLRPKRRAAAFHANHVSHLDRTCPDQVGEKEAASSDLGRSDVFDQEAGLSAEDSLAKCNVLALEAGIIFHSIIIGVTIGTASGEGWVVSRDQGGALFWGAPVDLAPSSKPLLIAITFHQLCEGLGLASRIALLRKTAAGSLLKIAMCSAFCLTTPVGIAIGIGVRQSL